MITPEAQSIVEEINRHIAVLNDDYTAMSVAMAILTERVEWLCKFFWLIIGVVLTTVITNFWQLGILLKKKNGDKPINQ